MPFRPKTKQRLAILTGGGLLLTAAAAGGIVYRLDRHERRQAENRAAGMAAYDRGDYRGACEPLRKYLGNDTVDAKAVFALAVSRSKVASPDQSNLLEAKRLFNRYLELEPSDDDARRRLLDVYRRLNDPYDAAATADAILARSQDDIPALTARRQAQVAGGDTAAALTTARRIATLDPDRVESHEVVIELMSRQSRPAAEITGYADDLLKSHGGDPRFELLRAVAAFYTGDDGGTKDWLRRAAAGPSPSADFTRLLAKTFDQIGLWDDARQTLERADPRVTSPALTAYAVRRLFQSGRYDAALARLSDAGDSDLLGLKGLLLVQTNRPADDVVRALGDRPDDVAASWATLLSALTAKSIAPAELEGRCRSAAVQNPDSPEARFYLGRANLARGETDRAIDNFRQAQQLAPAWWEPFTAEADALLAGNRVTDAAAPAYGGYDRSPDTAAARATELVAAYRALPPSARIDGVAPLVELAAHAHADSPDDGRVAGTYVALLTRAGRGFDAAVVATAALRRGTPSVLYPVASAAVAGRLKLEDQIISACEAVKPASPQEAYDRAAALALVGRRDAAVARIDADTAGKPPPWALVRLQLHDAVRRPAVPSQWAALAAAAPGDLDVQQAVLKSPSARTDRPLIDQTIDRLKAITGEDAVAWRMAKVRFELESPDAAHAVTDAAATSMASVVREVPRSIEAIELWAESLERTGDLSAATAALDKAADVSPGDPGVGLRIARLMLRTGRPGKAIERLDGIAGTLSPAADVTAADLYARAGSVDGALELLRRDPPDTDHDLAIAVLLDRRGDESVEPTLDRLFQTDPTSAVVRATAWHYGRRGDVDRGRGCLDKLDESTDPAGTELTVAEFESTFGTAAAADAAFAAAVRMGGEGARFAWAASRLRRREFAAVARVDRGSARLTAIADAAGRLASIPWSDDLQPLVDAIATDPTDDAATATLAAVGSPAELAKVAAKYPVSWPVRALLVTRAMAEGRYDDGVTAAKTAADAWPADPSPARTLATVYGAGHRWDDCRSAAVEYRNRGGGPAADLLLAKADLHVRQQREAVSLLQSRFRPDGDAEVVDTYCRALAMDGRDVGPTLTPLCRGSVDWRRRWCGIVRDSYSDADRAATDAQAIRAMIPAGSAVERLSLAEATHGAGVRLRDHRLLSSAADVLEPLTDSPTVPPAAYEMLGAIRQTQNNLEAAEAAYRSALAGDPSSPTTLNNLADVILRRGGDTTEAKRLAAAAVRALPAGSAPHGTLARAEMATGEIEAAKPEFEKAVSLDADAVDPRLGLADWYARRRQFTEPRRLLHEVALILNRRPEMKTDAVDAEVARLGGLCR